MLLNYNINSLPLEAIDFSKFKTINTINPHSYCVALKDIDFQNALIDSDVLLPDGIGIVWAEKFLNKNNIKKIAGYDLFLFLMNKLNNENGSVFFLGASSATLEKIRRKALIDYPNITLASHSPPYKDIFSALDSNSMCEKVNSFNPDVLFVGMTAPKQEKWVYQNKNELDVNTICSIGAVFDFYAENIERAPKLIVDLGLEWLHRSFKSYRLFRRNFISNPKFIIEILKLKLLNENSNNNSK